MSPRRADAIVLGAGVLGLAVAVELSRRSLDVAVLDVAAPGHPGGSSHGHARMRVAAAFPDAGYLERGRRADRGWAELEREGGESLRVRTGCLSWGEDEDRLAKDLAGAGERCERLSGDAVRRRFPGVTVPDGAELIFQPDGATLRADRALVALAAAARRHGAEVQVGPCVERVDAEGEGATVRTSAGSWRADVVVACLGASTPSFCAEHGVALPLTATVQTVSYFAWDGPPFPGLIEYGAPDPYACWCPVDGLKAAEHAAGPPAVAGAPRTPDLEAAERTRAWVAARFGPRVAARRRRVETCVYVSTPDERFAVARRGPLVVASACSGHGFQYAPDTAARVADVALPWSIDPEGA